MDTESNDNKDKYVWEITGTAVIDDKYVEEELKKEAKAFAKREENTGFVLRGLCGQDVSEIDMSNLSPEMFKKLTYDNKTKFSQKQIEKFHPFDIIEKGKQFANIEKTEFDGNGTTIAIIDRFSDISEKQFEGRTITVYRVSKDGVDKEPLQPNKKGILLESASVEEDELENGFHGNTVTSLAVGKECGIAPNANVVLFHIDGIDNQEAQNAVLKFVDENKGEAEFTVPDVISISAATEIDEEKLNELGCAFINSGIFMKDFTWGRSSDGHELVRDEFIEYVLEESGDSRKEVEKRFDGNILIPVVERTSSYINYAGEKVDKYNGSFCGNSFAICQIAGLFLIARQVDKSLSFDKFIEITRETAKLNGENMKYLDAEGIIIKVRDEKNKNILDDEKNKNDSAEVKAGAKLGDSIEGACLERKIRSGQIQEAGREVRETIINREDSEIYQGGQAYGE